MKLYIQIKIKIWKTYKNYIYIYIFKYRKLRGGFVNKGGAMVPLLPPLAPPLLAWNTLWYILKFTYYKKLLFYS